MYPRVASPGNPFTIFFSPQRRRRARLPRELLASPRRFARRCVIAPPAPSAHLCFQPTLSDKTPATRHCQPQSHHSIGRIGPISRHISLFSPLARIPPIITALSLPHASFLKRTVLPAPPSMPSTLFLQPVQGLSCYETQTTPNRPAPSGGLPAIATPEPGFAMCVRCAPTGPRGTPQPAPGTRPPTPTWRPTCFFSFSVLSLSLARAHSPALLLVDAGADAGRASVCSQDSYRLRDSAL